MENRRFFCKKALFKLETYRGKEEKFLKKWCSCFACAVDGGKL
jgi:hypothetical protein